MSRWWVFCKLHGSEICDPRREALSAGNIFTAETCAHFCSPILRWRSTLNHSHELARCAQFGRGVADGGRLDPAGERRFAPTWSSGVAGPCRRIEIVAEPLAIHQPNRRRAEPHDRTPPKPRRA